MCKGDGGRVLSNVELILPWNVVEACYTLERNDSTCFFAANDSEGTTSQISLCKLEDHSVKIQVTVTALEPDVEQDEDAQQGGSQTPHKKYTLWGSEGENNDAPDVPTPADEPRPPVRHQKKVIQEFAEPEEQAQPVQKKLKMRPKGMPKGMSAALWRRKKMRHRAQVAAALAGRKVGARGAGFNLKQARSVLEQKGVIDQVRKYPQRGKYSSEDPTMPVLEVMKDDQEIDLELIYKYGAQMRAYEEKRKREKEQEKANWEKVQNQLKSGKDGMSMVIVLKGEGENEYGGQEPEPEVMVPAVTPKLHVIEPLPMSETHQPDPMDMDNPGNADSTQVIYIHSQGKHRKMEDPEDIDEGKKFFKRRRDKGTRVAKDNGPKNKPVWKEQLKKSLKVEPERTGQAPGLVGCNFCPRTFKDFSYLFRHIKGHHMDQSEAQDILDELRPKMRVNCPICDKVISSVANIANHMKQCHPENETPSKCDMCDKTYKTPASLKQHIRQRHSDLPKKFNCPQCSMVFSERRGLSDHVNCVHETTQVYTCNKCWKVFLTKSRLRRHMYIHGEHRHICKHCGKGFHIKDNMNKHIRIVHEKNNGKMWKCSYCSKEFLVKGNMTQHIRGIHLKQFPFTCSKCQQGFRRMRDMMLHMEKCSPDESLNMEMFKKDVKQELPRRRGRPVGSTAQTMRLPKGMVVKQQTHDDEQEYVIHDEMVVSEDEEDYEELDEEEYEDEGEEEEGEETREVILNSHGAEDSMQLHIEQDGVVIPIEVVIGHNDGETEGAEVIADGAAE